MYEHFLFQGGMDDDKLPNIKFVLKVHKIYLRYDLRYVPYHIHRHYDYLQMCAFYFAVLSVTVTSTFSPFTVTLSCVCVCVFFH